MDRNKIQIIVWPSTLKRVQESDGPMARYFIAVLLRSTRETPVIYSYGFPRAFAVVPHSNSHSGLFFDGGTRVNISKEWRMNRY